MQSNPATSSITIANQAAGGNRILADGLGPNVLGRIDRDVLAQSGVKYAMIFEGVNDIGVASADPTNQTLIYNRLISAYEQIISRVHAQRIPMFAATITPFSGAPNDTVQPYSNPLRDETRRKVNDWIRNGGRFDAVVDFDRILADPNEPQELLPAYNSGDWLHPNVAGYQAIADQFPLDIFARFAGGVSGFV
jgi:lysophospholipase L1-like esterase